MKKLISLIASVAMVATTGFTTALADDPAIALLNPKTGDSSCYYSTASYQHNANESGPSAFVGARIEAESVKDLYGNASSAYTVTGLAGTSNGSYVVIPAQETNAATYTFKISVPVTGYYSFAAAIQTETFVSPTYVSFNGGEYEGIRVYANSTTTGTSEAANYTRLNRNNPSFGSGTYLAQIHRRNTPVFFTEGVNTIVLKSDKRQGYTSNGAPDNRVFASIDFIDIALVNVNYGNVVEAESQNTPFNVNTECASAKTVSRFADASKTIDTKTVTMNVSEAGLYTLKFGVASYGNRPDCLSPITVNINDTDLDFDLAHMTQMSYKEKQTASPFVPALYTFENIYLKAGVNTFTFTATSRPTNGGGTYGAIDFVDGYKTADVETYTVEDKGLVTKDEEAVGYYYTIGLSAIEIASEGVTLNTYTISSLPEVDCPTLLQYLILGGSYTETTIPAITKIANGSVEYYAE